MSRNLHTCGEYFLSFATLFNMLNMCSVLPDPLIPNTCVGLQLCVQYPEHVFYAVDITGTYRSPPMPASDANPAVAVERALNILEAAANRRDGMTNSEISRKLAIPKSSASYILRNLERRGYLHRDTQTGRHPPHLQTPSPACAAQAHISTAATPPHSLTHSTP